jgi:hypothetical protein
MRQVSEGEGRALVQRGEAGYYAVDAEKVTVHEWHTVVKAQGRFYLCGPEEIQVKLVDKSVPIAPVGDGGLMLCAAMHTVEVDEHSAIGRLLQRDLHEKRRRR